MTTSQNRQQWVVWIAGAGAPPDVTFGDCINAVGQEARSLPTGLELFEREQSDVTYSFAEEIDGILRTMDDRRIDSAHLVGYSGGGGIALALAMEHPLRVRTLTLDEPVIGFRLGVTDEEQFWSELDAALGLEGLDSTLAVVAATNAPGAPPPEFDDPPPPWLLARITGTPDLARAASNYPVSSQDLSRIQCPVRVTYGSNTRTVHQAWAEAIAASVAGGTMEMYEGCDHFRPAHLVHPTRYAAALLAHWNLAIQAHD